MDGSCALPGPDPSLRFAPTMLAKVSLQAPAGQQQFELVLGQRCIVKLEIDIQTGGDQTIADGPKPIGAFRMMGSHVVLPAVAMGNEGGSCHDGRLA